jgi:two-component system chemotaxis response regulator CheY
MKKILVVDDSSIIRNMAKRSLEQAGFSVTLGNDGNEGLAIANRERFDLIITDINMPGMTGLELAETIKKKGFGPNKQTNILILTTESDTEKKKVAVEAGVRGWITKPFNPNSLAALAMKFAV